MLTNVLIVGAGPTGLTLATELRRQGLNCRLVDAASGPCQQSRAIGIHARTLEHFEMLGVLEQFLAQGNKCNRITMHAHDKIILTLSLEELASRYPFVLLLPQSRTEQLLEEHLARLGGTVERNTSLIALEQSEEKVFVTLQQVDGSKTQAEYKWVIGCDGAHSAVRHAIKAPFHGSSYSEVFALADVEIENGPGPDGINMYTTTDGILGIFSLGGNRARIIADIDTVKIAASDSKTEPAEIVLPPPTLAQIQNLVAERGPIEMRISAPTWLAAFRIQRRQVDNYRQGRVFLAGDAAHIHSPAGGQGMNTGIQDAINLAWKLALVEKEDLNPALLDSYNAERHAVGRAVLRLSDFLTRVNTTRNPLAQKIRNNIAPILAGQELIQQRMRDGVAELAVNYRESPIVAEHKVTLLKVKPLGHSSTDQPQLQEWFDFDRGPRPGDRAPDAHFIESKSGHSMRLFELLKDHSHHLLLLSGVRASTEGNNNLVEIANYVTDDWSFEGIRAHIIAHDASGFADSPWQGSRLEDRDLSFHHQYGASAECLYLIRPDSYIAFRSLPADKLALEEYLSRVLS